MKYLLLIIFLFQSCSHVKEIPQSHVKEIPQKVTSENILPKSPKILPRRHSEPHFFMKTPNHPIYLRIKRDGKKLNDYMKSKKKLNDTKKD